MHMQTGMLGAAKPPPASPANSAEPRGTGDGSERLRPRLAPAAAAAARSRRRQQGPTQAGRRRRWLLPGHLERCCNGAQWRQAASMLPKRALRCSRRHSRISRGTAARALKRLQPARHTPLKGISPRSSALHPSRAAPKYCLLISFAFSARASFMSSLLLATRSPSTCPASVSI